MEQAEALIPPSKHMCTVFFMEWLDKYLNCGDAEAEACVYFCV